MDYVVVEASRVAEPNELATMLRLKKNNYAHFDALTTVIDGANVRANNRPNVYASAISRRGCVSCVSKGWLGTTPDSGLYAVTLRGWR